MRAVGYRHSHPIDHPESLIDVELDKPTPQGRDLLVAVKAVSVNPVDTKVRKRADPKGKEVKVLGYDAAGVIEAVGPEAKLFKPGDEVFYAGSIARSGSNAEFHLVDERIVGSKPKSLDFAAAAALPLTAITAWEMLFDRFGVPRDGSVPGYRSNPASLLIIGGAGGVGSIAIQLARKLTKLTVIATASRPETQDWCRALGAHHVVDHSKPMVEQCEAVGHRFIDLIFGVTHSDAHFPVISELAAPQGKFGFIDDLSAPDLGKIKSKCVSICCEAMFARSVFQTPDMIKQHELLDEVARLVDAGVIKTTHTQTIGKIDAATLKRAHAMVESETTKGKITLAGF